MVEVYSESIPSPSYHGYHHSQPEYCDSSCFHTDDSPHGSPGQPAQASLLRALQQLISCKLKPRPSQWPPRPWAVDLIISLTSSLTSCLFPHSTSATPASLPFLKHARCFHSLVLLSRMLFPPDIYSLLMLRSPIKCHLISDPQLLSLPFTFFHLLYNYMYLT